MLFLLYCLIGFLLVGGIGMWLGSRKADNQVRRQRWLKYVVYVVITNIILVAIWYNWFNWVVLIIIIAGYAELSKTIFTLERRKTLFAILSLLVYANIGVGAWLFANHFTNTTQLFFYFQVFIFDAFCQVTGQLFGKRLLAPAISPGKTVEGFTGGWLFCILAAMLGAQLVSATALQAVRYGLLTGIIALSGDLLASWYKRKVHIKDYSNLLPGQGGFLDRFDSLLMTMAVYYLLSLAGLSFP